jgi:hypothetical protein
MENHGGMISTEELIRLPELYWQYYEQSSSSKAGVTGRRNDEFSLRNIYFNVEGFFNML